MKDVTAFLAGTVRTLVKRVEALEKELKRVSGPPGILQVRAEVPPGNVTQPNLKYLFDYLLSEQEFSPFAPPFYPFAPPGIHKCSTDNPDFDDAFTEAHAKPSGLHCANVVDEYDGMSDMQNIVPLQFVHDIPKFEEFDISNIAFETSANDDVSEVVAINKITFETPANDDVSEIVANKNAFETPANDDDSEGAAHKITFEAHANDVSGFVVIIQHWWRVRLLMSRLLLEQRDAARTFVAQFGANESSRYLLRCIRTLSQRMLLARIFNDQLPEQAARRLVADSWMSGFSASDPRKLGELARLVQTYAETMISKVWPRRSSCRIVLDWLEKLRKREKDKCKPLEEVSEESEPEDENYDDDDDSDDDGNSEESITSSTALEIEAIEKFHCEQNEFEEAVEKLKASDEGKAFLKEHCPSLLDEDSDDGSELVHDFFTVEEDDSV